MQTKRITFLQKQYNKLYLGKPSNLTIILFTVKRLLTKKEQHEKIDKYIKEYIHVEISNKERKKIYRDTYSSTIKFGVNYEEYFVQQFYNKSDFYKKEYASGRFRTIYRNSLNASEFIKYFRYKNYVYEAFADQLNRDFLIVDKNTSVEKFNDFIKLHSEFICKPIDGDGGFGVKRCKLYDSNQAADFFRECMEEPKVIEEIVLQIDDLKSFAPSSVNTIRIITVVKNGKAKTKVALLRMGREIPESCVDNFSSGGLVAPIDIETGIITACAVDKGDNKYITHPVTNKQIVGFKIPQWEEYVEYSEKLALVIPQVRYVGWDIVMNESGKLLLIEANAYAGMGIQEKAMNTGLKRMYLDAIK